MDHAGRIARVREAMARRGIGLLYLPFGSDAAWLTGLGHEVPNPTVSNRPGDVVAGLYLGPERGPVAISPRMGGEGVRADAADKPWVEDVVVLGEPADYEAALRAVVDARGAKAKDVFQPVRVALAGTATSPGIFESLAVLGRDAALQRVDQALAGVG